MLIGSQVVILLVIIKGIAWKLEIQFCAESKTNQKCQKWIDVKWINGHLDRRKKFQFALNEVFRRVFIATVKMQTKLSFIIHRLELKTFELLTRPEKFIFTPKKFFSFLTQN